MASIKPLTGKVSDFSGIVLKAAARGDAKAVRHYLKANPDWLNQEGPHGRTLIWEAAYKGRTKLVAELIRRGADVDCLGSYYTPMLVELSPWAVAHLAGRTELVEVLEAAGASDDLYAACHRGDLEAINGFLTDDSDAVNRPAREHVEPHRFMGYHPIHYAVAGKQLRAAKLLVSSGADVDEHLPLLLEWAGDDRELTRYLKELGGGKVRKASDIRSKSDKDYSKVPAIDRPNWQGIPALVEACRGNHNAPDDPARVRKVLDRGANINIKDYKKKTALHRAGQAGFIEITKLLLDSGADLEATDEKDCTPLFDAALHGRSETIKMLIERGASLSHTDRRGETPLFAAARGAKPEALQTLLDAGADASVVNVRGKRIDQIVAAARHQTDERKKILKILKRKPAKRKKTAKKKR